MAVSPNPWHNITLAECNDSSSGVMIMVPSLFRVVLCKDDAARTWRTILSRRKWDDNVNDVVKKSDGRIIYSIQRRDGLVEINQLLLGE